MNTNCTKDNGRLAIIDIAKGILIILVVMGHIASGGTALHHYIFWFHMPAFLLISGFFIRSTFVFKEEMEKKLKRLMIPYLFFSILLGTIARNGAFLKQLLGTIWGGNANITYCTFPYYFITALFCSYVLYYALNYSLVSTKKKWMIAASLYAMMYFVSKVISDSLLGWIPWDIDKGFYVLIYLMLGKEIAKRKLYFHKKWIGISVLVIAVLVLLERNGIYWYDYDLKHHDWILGLDIVIPMACLVVLFLLSRLIAKIPFVNGFLGYIGKGSMVVLLLHPLFIWKLNPLLGNDNILVLTVINILCCMLAYSALRSNQYTRIIIGEK